MANLKDAFKIRLLPESEEYIITIGNHLATEQKFKSEKAAQIQINKTNWDLVSALVYALKEADEWAKKNPELINQAKEAKEGK
nr:MAG TPA: hypothetical protein [Microviridae sp.]